MIYQIDEMNWNAYKQRALKEDRYKELGDMKKEFRKTHKLMEKMVQCEEERTLVISMKALTSFLDWVYRRTGISSTPSNFIISKEEAI